MKDPKVIKTASTGKGWAIGLIERFEWKTGAHYDYAVIRINPQGQYLVLSSHKDLTQARGAANAEWAADSGIAA